jgi:rubrerythrin
MLEQETLRERFQAVLVRQQQAWQVYSEFAAATAEKDLKEKVAQLARDKQRHIRLTERLLEIVA